MKSGVRVPPLESFMMNEHPFPTAQYIPQIKDGVGIQESEWIIEPTISAQPTPWCQLNPKSLFRNAKPIIVDVSAGETLYLPSLWYHSVLQVDEKMDGFSGTIAVNWWYDMDYTPFSVAIETVKRLGRILEYGSDWQTKSVSDGSDSDT